MLTISSKRNSGTPSPMSKNTFSYTQRIEILVQPPHNLRVILVRFNIDPNRSRLYNNQFKRAITINNGVLMIMITRIHIIYPTLFFSGPCEFMPVNYELRRYAFHYKNDILQIYVLPTSLYKYICIFIKLYIWV